MKLSNTLFFAALISPHQELVALPMTRKGIIPSLRTQNIKRSSDHLIKTLPKHIEDWLGRDDFEDDGVCSSLEDSLGIFVFGMVAANNLMRLRLNEIDDYMKNMFDGISFLKKPLNIFQAIPVVSIAISVSMREEMNLKLDKYCITHNPSHFKKNQLSSQQVKSFWLQEQGEKIIVATKVGILYPITGLVLGTISAGLGIVSPFVASVLELNMETHREDVICSNFNLAKDFLKSAFVSSVSLILLPIFYATSSVDGLISHDFKKSYLADEAEPGKVKIFMSAKPQDDFYDTYQDYEFGNQTEGLGSSTLGSLNSGELNSDPSFFGEMGGKIQIPNDLDYM
ncbi:MAG: hypothetical protein SFT91_04790 [Rickettsiaceae bacterium]|nr:hypothetical protein [Rickettsiaceae bacterium]